jgi:hypothetical protein
MWPPQNRNGRPLCDGFQSVCNRALTAALAEATSATRGEMEFVAAILYSAIAGATRSVLEAGASEKMVVRLREDLLVRCGRTERLSRVLKSGGAIARHSSFRVHSSNDVAISISTRRRDISSIFLGATPRMRLKALLNAASGS